MLTYSNSSKPWYNFVRPRPIIDDNVRQETHYLFNGENPYRITGSDGLMVAFRDSVVLLEVVLYVSCYRISMSEVLVWN